MENIKLNYNNSENMLAAVLHRNLLIKIYKFYELQ